MNVQRISSIRRATATAEYVEHLFRGHRDALLRYLNGLLPNAEDAAELLQETYVRLLRQEGLAHMEANARAYVFQIATNLARDYFRQRKAHCADRHIPLDPYMPEAALQEPEASVQQDDLLERFRRTLLRMRPPVREVFLLHRFRNMSYAEITRALGLSHRTAERYMSEAIAQLRESLELDL